jgi:hypothetical protein
MKHEGLEIYEESKINFSWLRKELRLWTKVKA